MGWVGHVRVIIMSVDSLNLVHTVDGLVNSAV